MRIAVTGAGGFLGWHVRCRLWALHPDVEVVPVTRADWRALPALLDGVDTVIHLAGVNRGTDVEVRDGNVSLARDLAVALAGRRAGVVFANSSQAGDPTPYGQGKLAAAAGLEAATAGRFVDVRLPNVFGEHGRARYNSFVATFVDAVVAGYEPQLVDRPISMLHAQRAADVLIGAALGSASGVVRPAAIDTTVVAVWEKLTAFHELYAATGDLPALPDEFTRDLFNTYRARLFPSGYPIRLQPRTDDRGRLVETVRTHGLGGQTFVSTTRPGVTRGEHCHLRKIERFCVLDGSARIELRRLFTDDVVRFDVTGDEPVVIDMPTMWVHNLTATGTDTVTTLFWTNELFDPADPDTYQQKVRP